MAKNIAKKVVESVSKSEKAKAAKKAPKKASKVAEKNLSRLKEAQAMTDEQTAQATNAYNDYTGLWQMYAVVVSLRADRFEILENKEDGSAFVFHLKLAQQTSKKSKGARAKGKTAEEATSDVYGDAIPYMACKDAFRALHLVNAEQRAENEFMWRAEQEEKRKKLEEMKETAKEAQKKAQKAASDKTASKVKAPVVVVDKKKTTKKAVKV